MRFQPGRLACVAVALALTALPAGVTAQTDPSGYPKLAVTTLDGTTFDLAAHRGQWVIVNFWATWCSPCVAEMPAISEYVAAHEHVTAIGLAWQDTPRGEVVKFAKEHPVDYPLAQLDVSRPPEGFAAPEGLPTTYLIAPDGRMVRQFIGPVNAKLLNAAIAAAAGQLPSTFIPRARH